jgi:hypothetical protein
VPARKLNKRSPGKPQASDKRVCEVAIAAWREGKTQDECAKLAGVCDYSLRRILARNPDYRAEWDEVTASRQDEWKQRFVEAVREGLSRTRAAAYVGIPDTTCRAELATDDDFRALVDQADVGFELQCVRRITEGKPGWQGSAWAVERRCRKFWAPPKVEFNEAPADGRVVKVRRILHAKKTEENAPASPPNPRPEPAPTPDVRAASA